MSSPFCMNLPRPFEIRVDYLLETTSFTPGKHIILSKMRQAGEMRREVCAEMTLGSGPLFSSQYYRDAQNDDGRSEM
jgi:hypothetical protein